MSNVSIASYVDWPDYDTFLIVSLSVWFVYDPNPLSPNPNPKKPVSDSCHVHGLGRTLTPLNARMVHGWIQLVSFNTGRGRDKNERHRIGKEFNCQWVGFNVETLASCIVGLMRIPKSKCKTFQPLLKWTKWTKMDQSEPNGPN